MKMDGNILVVADLGQLKAYRVVEIEGLDRHETTQVSHIQNRGTEKTSTVLELISDIDYIDPHKKAGDLLSDQKGRFGTSTGEEHDTALEHERRTLKAISEDIKSIIENESPPYWYLAFPKETHNELRDMLSADITKTLKKIVPADLTHSAKEKILSHFD